MLQVVLTPESRSKLLVSAGSDAHGKVIAHHVTCAFKPTEEEMADFPLGLTVPLDVVGYKRDSRGQAVVVELQSATTKDASGMEVQVEPPNVRGAVPHVTVSVAEGTKPVYSNELLESGYNVFLPSLRLEGVCSAVTFKQETVTSE